VKGFTRKVKRKRNETEKRVIIEDDKDSSSEFKEILNLEKEKREEKAYSNLR
jgi:hypothetical protein